MSLFLSPLTFFFFLPKVKPIVEFHQNSSLMHLHPCACVCAIDDLQTLTDDDLEHKSEPNSRRVASKNKRGTDIQN